MAQITQRKHSPALDGLRGFALILVFLFHTIRLPDGAYPFLHGVLQLGFWGVDLFFCLSGFLITGILYAAKDDQHYFRNFYARRALRIFPLYYFFLVLYYLLVVRLHVVNFGALKALQASEDLRWVWWYGTTIRIAETGHFLTASINHFWTLAVEEHFYLVWPFFVFLFSRRGLARSIVVMTVGALALRIWLERRGVSGDVITSLTLCRVDSFGIGGAVSLLLTSSLWRQRHRHALAMLLIPSGVAALVCEYAGGPWPEVIGVTFRALFFSLLIAFVLTQENELSRFLSLRPLRWVGKYSYALYIFHWPIQVGVARRLPLSRLVAKLHFLPVAILANMLLVGTLSSVAALMTWNLFEKQFITLKRFFPASRVPSTETVHEMEAPGTTQRSANA